MRALVWVGLAALAAQAWVGPAAGAETSVREANRDHLIGLLGPAWDPDAVVTGSTPRGEFPLTLAEAIERVLDMTHDRVRLADVAGPANHRPMPFAGDVWVMEFIFAFFFCPDFCPPLPPCPTFVLLVDREGHDPAPVALDPQLWYYGGDVVFVPKDNISTHRAQLAVTQASAIGWTTNGEMRGYDSEIYYGGAGSFFCFHRWGILFNFATFDGFVNICRYEVQFPGTGSLPCPSEVLPPEKRPEL